MTCVTPAILWLAEFQEKKMRILILHLNCILAIVPRYSSYAMGCRYDFLPRKIEFLPLSCRDPTLQ